MNDLDVLPLACVSINMSLCATCPQFPAMLLQLSALPLHHILNFCSPTTLAILLRTCSELRTAATELMLRPSVWQRASHAEHSLCALENLKCTSARAVYVCAHLSRPGAPARRQVSYAQKPPAEGENLSGVSFFVSLKQGDRLVWRALIAGTFSSSSSEYWDFCWGSEPIVLHQQPINRCREEGVLVDPDRYDYEIQVFAINTASGQVSPIMFANLYGADICSGIGDPEECWALDFQTPRIDMTALVPHPPCAEKSEHAQYIQPSVGVFVDFPRLGAPALVEGRIHGVRLDDGRAMEEDSHHVCNVDACEWDAHHADGAIVENDRCARVLAREFLFANKDNTWF